MPVRFFINDKIDKIADTCSGYPMVYKGFAQAYKPDSGNRQSIKWLA